MKKPLNIAHRGFSGIYPENTMLAFRKAVEVGCDGIETDMHLTKDGYPVICHDEKLDRTTNGTGLLCEYTFGELQKFDAGISKGEEFKGEKLPGIDEFFDYLKDKDVIINIELKTDLIEYENIEKKVFDKIYEYKLQDRIIISSFNHYTIKRCLELDSNIKTGLLYSNRIYLPGQYAEQIGATAIHPKFLGLTEEIVKNAHDHNIKINTWTVNEVEEIEAMIKLGVDGIISNYPDRVKELLSK